MPLNKLENFIKNYEGRILYVNSNDLDATDSITNQGNSLTKPFKTIQRALLEAARFSFVVGDDNDYNNRTTILVYPGDHTIDNRPGYGIKKVGTALAQAVAPNGNTTTPAADTFTLTLESNFDISQEDNILYKFNSVHGGVIIPRGTSLVGMDLRKTKIRPKYVPNPTDPDVPNASIFRITGECYFWQFSIFDADLNDLAYTDNKIFTAGSGNLAKPSFSHHKLTCFEYADGVNVPSGYNDTDLDMYYAKLTNAFNEGSGRQIPAAQKYPLAPEAFAKERAEWEIVGSFATDPIAIDDIYSGDKATPGQVITVKTKLDHGLTVGTPIKIRKVNVADYNVSTVVASVNGTREFTYLLQKVRNDLPADPGGDATVTIETDTVGGSSPYVFNCSLRSVWGMNGMLSDGNKSDGFKSMVVAQFTGISLQKDDRAFVKYNEVTRTYDAIESTVTKVKGEDLSSGSSSLDSAKVYHLDPNAVYRKGWETAHIKITNDSVLQVVSVFAIGFNQQFLTESGGDASVTNSNANFGQFALNATGFKKEAFTKDDHGYITNVISPKAIKPSEINVDWISIDVGLTTSVGITSHLYLYGFNSRVNVPPNLIQGYRVGAKVNDKLYLTLPNGTNTDVEILMSDNEVTSSTVGIIGSTSSVKEYTVTSLATSPNYDTITLNTDHKLLTGETIIIQSDVGDLPEEIEDNTKYYVITTGNQQQIKIASSRTNAKNGTALTLYGGSALRILSRVSDRDSGEAGSPIQWDPNNKNWFIHTNVANPIYTQINTLGTFGFGEPRTNVTYFKRIPDDRSIDEKVYKLRVVIPKEATNSKNPTDGFVIQESSSTGPSDDSELSLTTLPSSRSIYKRNNRFISTCTYNSTSKIVTVVAEQPHDLSVGERILLKNIKSSTNTTGLGVTGYNGDFVVNSITDDKTFTYSIVDNDGLTHNVGVFSGSSARNTTLPRFERNDLQSNFYVYRSDVISDYKQNVQDGIYHLYVLNYSNSVPGEFSNYKYSQNIPDLYPQLDRDNVDDNPSSTKSFAKRSPLGDVVTNDLKKSLTRESLDLAIKKFGVTPVVSNISPISAGISTITTEREHSLGGLVGFTTLTPGSGFSPGTYYNIKLNDLGGTWRGATATVTISGAGNSVTDVVIEASGGGYQHGTELNIDGFSGARIGITSACISSPVNNALQVTGIGTATDSLLRVVSVPSATSIAVARTTGDPTVHPGQLLFNVGPSTKLNDRIFNSTVGITTLVADRAHGLGVGNKIRVLDENDNNIGDYLISDVVGINTVAISTNVPTAANAGRILKYGFAANDATSDDAAENLESRGIPFYANESARLLEEISGTTAADTSEFAVTSYMDADHPTSGISTMGRFPMGSFIQVGGEIMRVSKSTLTGGNNNKITAIRGYLGTRKETHLVDTIIKKIQPIPIEFRRPSILRSSGQTFEYIGYGPGNYSTGLPQVQAKTLTEREDFLAQAQERSGGQVIYTGMNSDGDFFIGNTKYSASSGTQQTFDIPVSTVTGQDPSRLSVVFDEVIVKERILVEGGKSNQILSQFDGPVTFNENIILNDETKLNGPVIIGQVITQNDDTESTSCVTGSIVTKGGIGVAKNVNICGDVSVGGTGIFKGGIQFNEGLFAEKNESAFLGTDNREWSGAWIGGIGIATEGVAGGTEAEDRTIRSHTGPLILDGLDANGQSGIVTITNQFFVGGDVEIDGDTTFNKNVTLTGITTFNSNTHHPDNVKATFGNTAASPDFSIVHDTNNTILHDNGTGAIHIRGDAIAIQNAGGTETQALFNENERVKLFHDNTPQIETTLFGAKVDNTLEVGTAIVPDIDKGAAVGVATLPFSDAYIGNIRIAHGGGTSTNNNEIDTVSGDLILDSTHGNVIVDDGLTVNQSLSVASTSNFEGNMDINANIDMDGNLDLDGRADIDNIRIDGNTISSQNSNGVITLDPNGSGDVNIEGPLDVNSSLDVSGATTLNGNVDLGDATGDTISFGGRVDTDLDPSADATHSLGNAASPQLRWNTLEVVTVNATTLNGAVSGGQGTFGNIQIAVTNDNTIDTSTGDLDLNAAGNDVNINASSFNIDSGTINLGDGTADNIVFNGRIDSHLIPDDDDEFNLGSSTLEWNDLWIDGTANIDSLVADTAKVSDLTSGRVVTVGTDGELQDDGEFTYNRSTDTLTVGGITIDGSGTTTITATTFSGNASSADLVEVESRNNTSSFQNIVFTGTSLSSSNGGTVNAQLRADQSSGLQYKPSDETLQCDGDIIAFHSSDSRLKNNINPIEDALTKLRSISGNTFEWNEISGKTGSDTGVIAQEVEAIELPGLVTTRKKTGYKAVKYERLTALLIEAVKELADKVDNLEQKLSDK